MFGLRWLDSGTAAEDGVEFSSGTANITFPREIFNNDKGRNVEALWVFEKTLEGVPGVTLIPKKCVQRCRIVHGKHQTQHIHRI